MLKNFLIFIAIFYFSDDRIDREVHYSFELDTEIEISSSTCSLRFASIHLRKKVKCILLTVKRHVNHRILSK